jgi:hypothetical protein
LYFPPIRVKIVAVAVVNFDLVARRPPHATDVAAVDREWPNGW